MALCAAFFRFMTAAASVSCASIERVGFLEEETNEDLGEASGEDGEEIEDDVDAMVWTGDKLPHLVSLLCDGDHMSLSGSWQILLVSSFAGMHQCINTATQQW